MSKRRTRFVYAIAALIFGGSLFDIAIGREDWPLSPYAMYSNTEEARLFAQLRLFGVTREQPQKEIPLLESRYIKPFDQARLANALQRLEYEGGKSLLERAANDCLKQYETARRTARHEGPSLSGIRVYRVWWQLESSAENVDLPERRELIVDVPNRADE